MSAIREAVAALISGGMDPVDAAALIAAVVIEGGARKRSVGAERTARYRERKASQSVTCDADVMGDETPIKASQSVTKRHIVTGTTISKEKISSGRITKSRTSLPSDFKISDQMRTYASGKGIPPPQIDRQAEKFCNYHRSKGSLMADWFAAWRTWVGNAIEFEQKSVAKDGFKWNGIEGVI